MSFSFTCYGNDESVASTSIYVWGLGLTYPVNYGETLTKDGFTQSIRFTAKMADGCSFTRWVYRLGSVTGTVYYSYSNPFTYTGDQNIYIRAEGESDSEDTGLWSFEELKGFTGVDPSNTHRIYYDLTLKPYYCYCWGFTIQRTSTLNICTTGSAIDTYGFLSTSNAFDSDWGEPVTYISSDDNGGDGNNFLISGKLAAGTYYIFVRGASPTTSGSTRLWLESVQSTDASQRPDNFAWTYSKVQGEDFNLTADEWNALTSKINAFRVYKGLNNYTFTKAYTGNDFTADMYNEARIAIQGMTDSESKYGSYIPTVTSGQDITAVMMNIVVTELNVIP